MARNTLSRSMHDLGLSAWFGGTLANAVSLNKASSNASTAPAAGAVADAGWDRWTPVNAAAIGIHVAGSLGQIAGNKGRLSGQQGVASMALAKTTLTAAALGVTAYSRVLGRKVSKHKDVPAHDATTPVPETPEDVAKAQAQLRALQWAVPATTAAILALNSYAGEQQRPSEVNKGMRGRVRSLARTA